MKQQEQEWDEEFETAQAKLAEVRRAEDKARVKLGEARSRYERAKSMLARAHKKEAEVSGNEREARCQAEDLVRWKDEVRRKERELRTSHEDVKGEIAEVGALAKGAHAWELRLKFLVQHRGRRVPVVQPRADGVVRPLSVTGRATSVLKDMLDGMERGPEQALRLVAGPDGSIALSLDTQREGDNVVSHEGAAVLFIGSPVPGNLQGVMLDVSDTPGGPTIVLSR